MKRSTDRILTTHVGSLIRPAPLQDFLRAKQSGKPYDAAAYQSCLKTSVAEVVRKQAEIGVADAARLNKKAKENQTPQQ